MANYLKKKRIRRRKIDKGNYLQLSNCYCLLTPTPHPPTCIHMLLLRRERKQKKKGAQLLSFPVCTLIYWQWGHRFRQGRDTQAREVTLLKKMMLSFISIHILLVFLFFIFLPLTRHFSKWNIGKGNNNLKQMLLLLLLLFSFPYVIQYYPQ